MVLVLFYCFWHLVSDHVTLGVCAVYYVHCMYCTIYSMRTIFSGNTEYRYLEIVCIKFSFKKMPRPLLKTGPPWLDSRK